MSTERHNPMDDEIKDYTDDDHDNDSVCVDKHITRVRSAVFAAYLVQFLLQSELASFPHH